jgi:hypothetical protein
VAHDWVFLIPSGWTLQVNAARCKIDWLVTSSGGMDMDRLVDVRVGVS